MKNQPGKEVNVMNKLQIFNSNEFGYVRTCTKDNEPMFCLADVCKALELEQVSRVKSRLKEDGVTTNKVIDSMGRTQTATFINEANLYKVIFQSRKESAERFTDWVTSEVLPTIRKNGAYLTDSKAADIVSNPQNLIDLLNQAAEQLKQKDIRIEEMRPKEIFADAVSTSNTSILIGELAKVIKQNGVDIGQNRLFKWLRNNHYLMSNNEPTQKSMEMKLFEVMERTVNNPDGSVRITRTTKVTGKGQQYFINKFLSA